MTRYAAYGTTMSLVPLLEKKFIVVILTALTQVSQGVFNEVFVKTYTISSDSSIAVGLHNGATKK
jgi:hypothetical protein